MLTILAISTSFLLAALLFAMFWLYANARDKYTILKHNRIGLFVEHIDSLYRIINQRTGLSNYIYAIENNEHAVDTDQVFDEIDAYINYCLEETRYIFERATGRRCAVTIKLIHIDQDKELFVSTFARDRNSAAERSETDDFVPHFKPDDHSPFGQILADLSGEFGFVENDLHGLDDYVNANPKWRDYYNATCVVPIARPEVVVSPNEEARTKIVGFLCVDSLSGRFDREFSIAILKIISVALYYTFETILQLRDLYSNKKVLEDEEGTSE